MYLDFFKLQREPFHITPDPAFFYLFPSHREALAALLYGVDRRKGFVAVTGEVGVGKTIILRAFLERLNREHTKVIYLLNANVPFEDLLRTLLQEFGYTPEADSRSAMVNQVHWVLVEHLSKDRNVALIIDEAQNMPAETMEGLRILSNLETTTDKLLQIVFCGQPELDEKLARPELRQLKQRIAVQARVSPLTRAEGTQYIQHRLATAGAPDTTVFTKGAVRQIVSAARGMPRVINILCDNALATALGYQQRRVTRRVVKEIIRDFKASFRLKPARWRLATAIGTGTVAVAVSAGFLFLDDPGHEGLARSVPQGLAQLQGGVQVQANRDGDADLPPNLSATKQTAAANAARADAENPRQKEVGAQVQEKGLAVQSPITGEKGRQEEDIPEPLLRQPAKTIAAVANLGMADTRNREADSVVVQTRVPIEAMPVTSASGHGVVNRKSGSAPTRAQEVPRSFSIESDAVIAQEVAARNPVLGRSSQEAVMMIVTPGDRLLDLVAKVYGTRDQQFVQLVRQYNPQIKNANLIHVGDRLTFPPSSALSKDNDR